MSEMTTRDPVRIPKTLPVLPLRDMVVYPFIIAPLSIARVASIRAVDTALSGNRMVLLVTQKERDEDAPGQDDLYPVGTVAVIMRMLKLPDERIRVLVQGVCRARLTGLETGGPHLVARVEPLLEPPADSGSETPLECEALMRTVKKALERGVNLGKNLPSEVQVIANNLEDPGRLADLVASNLELDAAQAQQVLEIIDPLERLRSVAQQLKRELDLLSMQHEIDSLARDEIDRSQREYYLRQQMKAIRNELGEGSELEEEIDEIREKIGNRDLPEAVREEIERELRRLERMHPDAAESATIRHHLEWLVELPWDVETEDNLELGPAKEILDEDHYGLDPVKERIIEYLAVRKLKERHRGPLLCFVGPPGVGKTSLGRSIARAMGRKFVRVSLGGVRDEAEIRGHRRTYIGSMPGRIIQSIRQAGSRNPVMMLDEVDKLGNDFRGDPQAALLEVLDPEQNNSFRDHYLGVSFDLSQVMFIATANLMDTIHPAFRDRMEVIRIPGYTEEEKLEIAKRHLIPKQVEENALSVETVRFSEGAVRELINRYTREAGLRNLERRIAAIARKVARKVAEGRRAPTRISASSLEAYLGPPPPQAEDRLEGSLVGVATGLAWTAAGGDVLSIEALKMKGKGRLHLTGQLGAVMKESGQAALSWARSRAAELGLEEDDFSGHDIHVHVPEGAIPKDGPSAGITMATVLVSVLTDRPVRRDVAMTGEITLRGRVLPVGGVKEKVLAARRAGAKTVILPRANEKDLHDLPRVARRELEFVFVESMEEVLAVVLAEPPAAAESRVDAREDRALVSG
ncbi:MAG: endopeptidase La [Acidobacteriota bacterium]|nr:endopeptidase La [Acidobacteriota bacterium]MDQ7088532.1 endopeptidase La [Acidobacteriota bacterium]